MNLRAPQNKVLRWIGGITGALSLFAAMPALALTDEEILQRLEPVPVFTIADTEGNPLVIPTGEEGNIEVAGVFISQDDAQSFIDTTLRSSNPELAADVQVILISLAEVYKLALESRANDELFGFTFIPIQEEVASAISLLQRSGQTVEGFDGVPIFYARSTSEDGGYLTIEREERQIIPMYFEQEVLQQIVDTLKQRRPEMADTLVIEVTNLETLIQTFQQSDDPGLNQIQLIPPRESLEYVLQNAQPPQGQPTQGQPTQEQPAQGQPTP